MEENLTSQSTNDLFKNAARFGAINGGIGVLLTVVLYVVNYELLVSWKLLLFMIALFLGLVIYEGISYRKSVGGYLTFGKAFQHGYVVLIVGGFVSIIFSIVLYQIIDTDLPQKLTDVIVENTEAMMQGFGAPEDKIDEALKQVKIDTPQRFTILGQLKQFGWGFLINAVIALITGAIVKRNQPVEM